MGLGVGVWLAENIINLIEKSVEIYAMSSLKHPNKHECVGSYIEHLREADLCVYLHTHPSPSWLSGL